MRTSLFVRSWVRKITHVCVRKAILLKMIEIQITRTLIMKNETDKSVQIMKVGFIDWIAKDPTIRNQLELMHGYATSVTRT